MPRISTSVSDESAFTTGQCHVIDFSRQSIPPYIEISPGDFRGNMCTLRSRSRAATPRTLFVTDKVPQESQAPSAVLDNLRAGQPVLSLGVRNARTADIARLARSAGYRVIWVDLEHSSLSIDCAAQILASAFGLGLERASRLRSASKDRCYGNARSPRMFAEQRNRFHPLPDFSFSQMINPNYTALLMEQRNLPLRTVILLDRVQKRQPIPKDDVATYKQLIVKYLQQYRRAGQREIDTLRRAQVRSSHRRGRSLSHRP
jgi:hypothetical protein